MAALRRVPIIGNLAGRSGRRGKPIDNPVRRHLEQRASE
jgi:hypothetical protein